MENPGSVTSDMTPQHQRAASRWSSVTTGSIKAKWTNSNANAISDSLRNYPLSHPSEIAMLKAYRKRLEVKDILTTTVVNTVVRPRTAILNIAVFEI